MGARAIIDLENWYERQWADGIDFKQELIALLDASKFGSKEYTPYQVYMKALYEYFRDELGGEAPRATRSAVNLAEFQEDAVKKARKILSRYDGVMVADSVGLGKTWIGKKLLEDFAYHMRQKALVVCPGEPAGDVGARACRSEHRRKRFYRKKSWGGRSSSRLPGVMLTLS